MAEGEWKTWAVVGVAFSATIALAVYQHNLLMKKNAELQSAIVEQKKIVDEVVRSQSSLSTRQDLENKAKELGLKLDPITKDIESLGGKLQGINSVITSSNEQVMAGVSSTSKQVLDLKNTLKVEAGKPVPKPVQPAQVVNGVKLYPDPYGYMDTIQEYQLNEDFAKVKIPIAKVGFAASQEKPWYVTVPKRQYKITNVLSVNKQGRNNIYNRLSITSNGKTYEMPIESAQYQEIYPVSEFSFNPRLYLGLGVGATFSPLNPSANANLELSLFSWGRTDLDIWWQLLSFGAAYDFTNKSIGITFSPAKYNIGKHIPLMQNLFIGPQVTYGLNGNFSVLLGLSAGL